MSTGLRARHAPGTPLSPPSLSRRYLRLSAALPLLAVLVCGVARATDADEPQQVVVSATRTPTPAVEVASSITVITADDIEARQERTISDVLKDVPGLNVVQTGGPGGVTSVFIRGTNSNHTKVLIDGIDVSDPSNSTGAFDFGQLLTPDIERIEVLRGPQSGLYGSDAIGGVINIITRSGSGPMTLAAGLEGGSFETFNQAARLSGSREAFHYGVNVTHFHAGATPVTPLDLLPAGAARNDDYNDNLTLSTRLGYDITSNFDLGLVARYTDIHLHTTGEDYPPPLFTGVPAAEQTTAATDESFARLTAHAVSFDGLLDQTLGLAYSHLRTSTVQPQTPAALNTGERRKADWQGNFRLAPSETLVVGAEYERDEIDQPITASVHIGSGYAELQSQVGSHWFSALNVRYDDNSRFGGKTTWRFAPAWVIADSDTKLKASVGTGFKAPTLSELYQSFPPFFFANPDLKPENSTGWDVGFEQGVLRGLVRLGVTYYYNRIHDLVTTDVTGTTYANIGEATTDGIESFIAWQPLKELTLRLDYTYTEATDEVLHQELLRRPKHKGTLLAHWQATSAWQLSVDVLAVGAWVDGNRDFSIPRLDAPGYTTVNFATSYELNPHFALFGRINNLLDRHYQNPVGFLQPGIGAYAGVRVTL
ncbi:MAG TPA: TonB-dependent receptor [Steroidobacteraceae bacterium]|nr:TonB-dependent receptor [Steroidobacteraceae bacterium]